MNRRDCGKGSRGTKDQLLVDKAILKKCRRRLTYLSMAWIDYKKAYDMVPHSWIMICLGWGCQEYDLYNQQQHGELEDSIDIRRNGSRAGGH